MGLYKFKYALRKGDKTMDPGMVPLFEREIQPDSNCIDVGASHGICVMHMSKVASKGTVLAVEPEGTSFALMKKHLEMNDIHNVKLEQCALSDKIGTGILYINKRNCGDHRMWHEKIKKFHKRCGIEVTTIDDLTKDMDLIFDFVKVNIQGFEFNFFQGATNFLKKHRSKFLVAYWTKGILGASCSLKQFGEFLFDTFGAVYNVQGKEILTYRKLLKKSPNTKNKGFRCDLLCSGVKGA